MSKKKRRTPISPAVLERTRKDGESSVEKPRRSRTSSRRRFRARPNWRFMVRVLAAVLAGAGFVFLVHRSQMQNLSDRLLVRSQELERSGQTADAVRYLRRYLALRPNEIDSRRALAEMLQASARDDRARLEAYLLNERVLQSHPDDHSVLRRQVDLAIELDRNRDALVHLRKLKGSEVPEGELEFLHARAIEGDGQLTDAAIRYRSAIEQEYHEADVYLRLASLLERLGQPEAADETVQEMVTANPKSLDALLARAQYNVRKGRYDPAIKDLERAEELNPESSDVVLLRAKLILLGAVQDGGQAGTASIGRKLREAISREPKLSELYLTAAQIELAAGRAAKALEILGEGCRNLPDDAQLQLVRTDLLMETDRLEEADQQIERLRGMGIARAYLDFLQARRLVQQGEYVEAMPQLRAVAASAARRQRLRDLALLQLGKCCEKIGDFAGQLTAAEQILAGEPLSRQARLMAASALAELNRLDEALEHYGHLAHVEGVPLRIARLLITRNLRLLPAERDWVLVTRVLEQAAAESAEPVPALELQATVLMLQGRGDAAQSLLQESIDDVPTDPRRWAASIRLAIRRGEKARVRELLDAAEQQVGDDVLLRLARAEFLARTTGEEADAQLETLIEDTEKFSEDERVQLLEGLSVVQFRRGEYQAAAQLWQQIVRKQPWRVDLLLRLFQSALRDADRKQAESLLAAIRKAEGVDGLHVRTAEALLMIWQAEQGDPAGIAAARERLSQLAADYSHWPTLAVAQARIDEEADNPGRAADHYLRAVTQGNRDPRVIRRALELLLTLDRPEDRDRLIEVVQQDATVVVRDAVQRLSAELALRNGKQDEAVQLALAAVETRQADSGDYVWLGSILDAAGRPKEALETFEKAIGLAADRPAPWQALINALIRNEQPDAAKDALLRAEQALSERNARLLAAQSYSRLGRIDEAAENYQAVLKLAPDDSEILRQAAGFYLQQGDDSEEAEHLLRRYLSLKPAPPAARLGAARRLLAELLAAQTYPQFLEAISLIDDNLQQLGANTADQRIKGLLLLKRPYPQHLRTAISLLEQVRNAGQLSLQDRQVLAAAYERAGEAELAEQEWDHLLTGQPPAAVIRQHLRYLLSTRRLEHADRWLERLRVLEPQEPATVSLAVRLAAQQGESATAIQAMKQFIDAGEETQQAERALFAARLLTAIAAEEQWPEGVSSTLLKEASGLYDRMDQSKPEVRFGQARLAAHQARVDAALAECEAAAESGASWQAVVATGIDVLRTGQSNQSEIARVESWLAKIPEDERGTVAVQLLAADLKMIQHKYGPAAELYADILKTAPDSVVALNNLAWIRSVAQQEHGEAIRLIERAIHVTGPLAELLDTRGTIRYENGQLAEAADDLQAAITQDDTAVRRFHIALVLSQLGEREAAAFHLRTALESGLTAADLYPHELARFENLLKEYGPGRRG